jgi:Abortive infection alpha
MSDETGLDVIGVGKLAKAIPQKAWVQVVDTACQTFEDAIAPFTATTSGIGRLIGAKFDRLIDAEKVLAAEVMHKATLKIAESKKKLTGKAKASVVVAAIEASSAETDDILRELWSNLLAQEIVGGDVHPEFSRILARLSSDDAKLLAQIAERAENKSVALAGALRKITAQISILGISLEVIDPGERGSFTHEHLQHLNLIGRHDGKWVLTLTGRAFIQAVSDFWQPDSAA